MDASLLKILLDPTILFFFFGMLAAFLNSNLEIPPAIAKFFSLYLLMAIGFKGGVALSESGISQTMVFALLVTMLMSMLVPAYSYLILRKQIGFYDAAAIAATYGSVSAVTFIAAGSFLTNIGVEYGGYMTVALVLMESPAIIMAVFLANMARRSMAKTAQANGVVAEPPSPPSQVAMGPILKEAFTDGAHLLLLGSLAIGFITGAAGKEVLQPFTGDLFKGILAFFLLEMGLLVARRMREAKGISMKLVTFAIFMPIVNASVATLLAWITGLPLGDTLMVAVLSASASYIVVPAVVRYAIPEADPGRYFTMALAITFPFNIILGIPLYYNGINFLWGL